MVHQVIEAAVQELLREIGLSAVIMQAGSSITTTMAPALPYVAAAKVLVHLINEALELRDKLTGGLLG